MITTVDQLLAASATRQTFAPVKYGATNMSVAGYWRSSWIADGSYIAATPPSGSGEACGSSTLGRIPVADAQDGNTLHLSRFLFSPNQAVGCYLLDRLVHTSGLSGAVATQQAVNSVALPGRSDGVGTELWLEWYVATGATTFVATVVYTNSDGTPGRVSQVPVPATFRATGALRAPLQAGDRGVLSVQSVTLSRSSGTAGNFGITIAKRISSVSNMLANGLVGSGPIGLGLPVIPQGSCLYLINGTNSATSTTYDAELAFVEG